MTGPSHLAPILEQACAEIGCRSAALFSTGPGSATLAGSCELDAQSLARIYRTLRQGGLKHPVSDDATPWGKLPRVGYAVGHPLRVDGRPVGILVTVWDDAPPDLNGNPVVEAFASHVAIAVLDQVSMLPAYEAVLPLSGLTALARTSDDFVGLLAGLRGAMRALIPGIRLGLMLWDRETTTLQAADGSFDAERKLTSSYWVSDSDPLSNSSRVFHTGQSYMTNHPSNDRAVLRDYAEAFGLHNLISVRLVTGDRRIGVLHVADADVPFSTEHLKLVEAAAPLIAGMVDIARSFFELRTSTSIEGDLSRIAVSIATGSDIRNELKATLDRLCTRTDTDALALVTTEAQPIVGRRADLDDVLVSTLLRRAESMPAESNHVEGLHRAGEPGTSWLFLPVCLGQSRIGTLGTLRLKAQPFSNAERNTLLRLSGLITLGWAAERYQQQRAELARLHERARIADELHDNVAQLLFAGQVHLESLAEHISDPPEQVAAVNHAVSLLARAEVAIEEVISQLEPPKTDAFLDEIYRTVEDVERVFGTALHLDISGLRRGMAERISTSTSAQLAAAARECLTNAAKHNPRTCKISLVLQTVVGSRVRMTVIDDGVGIDRRRARREGHGLATLRRKIGARGGSMRITNVATGGTQVTISLPL